MGALKNAWFDELEFDADHLVGRAYEWAEQQRLEHWLGVEERAKACRDLADTLLLTGALSALPTKVSALIDQLQRECCELVESIQKYPD